MTKSTDLDIDRIIETLLTLRVCRPQTAVHLPEDDVLNLCRRAKDVFFSQPMMLKLKAPLVVLGDIHGQFFELLMLFDTEGFPPENNYLFLGDYVDRGPQSLEVIILLYAFKVKYPEKFHLLRGNHECAAMTRIYGFYNECSTKYNIKVWKSFIDCFDCMPVAAVIEENIFCCHGGISPELEYIEQVNEIFRPTDITTNGLLCDLVWADPQKFVKGFQQNERGVSVLFGADVVSNFLKNNNLDLICRAHQVVDFGFECFAKRQLVTLFSAPHYCGEFLNSAGVMHIDENLRITFRRFVFNDGEDYLQEHNKHPLSQPGPVQRLISKFL